MKKLFLSFLLVILSVQTAAFATEEFTLIEGDIAVKNSQLKSSFLRTANRWPGGVIPWTIDRADTNNTSLIKALNGAMTILNKYTNLVFKKRTDQDKNYIVFTSKYNGCFSYVGMQGGAQEVNLSNGCHLDLIVAHEILHAIGMEHEQSREDRDNYITILWDNIQESQKNNFGLVRRSNFGEYNLNSIMQYGSYSFSKNGKPTMITKNGSVFQQNLKYFSKGDQDAVNYFYPNKFVFDLESVGLSIIREPSGISYVQLDATPEMVKSIHSVVYKIDNRDISTEISSWENNFRYSIEPKKGSNIIHVTFNLRDDTQEEKEFEYFYTGRNISVNCQFEAKRDSVKFKVPISYEGSEFTSERKEIKDYFAEVRAIFNISTNVMELKMAVGRKAGLIRREDRQEEVFMILENDSHKVEVKNAELSCEAVNEAI